MLPNPAGDLSSRCLSNICSKTLVDTRGCPLGGVCDQPIGLIGYVLALDRSRPRGVGRCQRRTDLANNGRRCNLRGIVIQFVVCSQIRKEWDTTKQEYELEVREDAERLKVTTSNCL